MSAASSGGRVLDHDPHGVHERGDRGDQRLAQLLGLDPHHAQLARDPRSRASMQHVAQILARQRAAELLLERARCAEAHLDVELLLQPGAARPRRAARRPCAWCARARHRRASRRRRRSCRRRCRSRACRRARPRAPPRPARPPSARPAGRPRAHRRSARPAISARRSTCVSSHGTDSTMRGRRSAAADCARGGPARAAAPRSPRSRRSRRRAAGALRRSTPACARSIGSASRPIARRSRACGDRARRPRAPRGSRRCVRLNTRTFAEPRSTPRSAGQQTRERERSGVRRVIRSLRGPATSVQPPCPGSASAQAMRSRAGRTRRAGPRVRPSCGRRSVCSSFRLSEGVLRSSCSSARRCAARPAMRRSSSRSSSSRSRRQRPGRRSPSSMFITRTRRSSLHAQALGLAHAPDLPVAALRQHHAERRAAPAAATRHGSVRRPWITIPLRMRAQRRLRDRDVDLDQVLLLVAVPRARRIWFTSSPRLVSRIRPSLNLSSRPMWKMRSW